MPPILDVVAASKSYKDVRALTNVSLQVKESEVVSLLGPNGAGKSTLIKCISTLESLDQGTLSVAGYDVTQQPHLARSQFGYAGQDATLDKVLTAREFLRFQSGLVHLAKSEINSRVDELLKRFNLLDVADRQIETYSGGMKRRLDLAATLLHRPKLLILDEPSTGLDYESRRELWAFIRELQADGAAILLATHDFEEAEILSDRVAFMTTGQLCKFGTPQDVCSELGAWIVGASLNPHPQSRDRELLAKLFKEVPGTVMPENPQLAEFAVALPENSAPPTGSDWQEYLTKRAADQNLDLHSLSLRRPTLADAYLSATSRRNK
ncbi:MAG: ABC transporter ATP-binding protein [Planctomycetota bacterium]|jgi:ABC-2 type transport system ATP-binding protein|nr:ABC transporter ATP-binding protein [Planctomycetota bacterium]